MNDRDYMLRAIELAKKGVGWTSPNPMVGAVIVKDGVIIGEGFHERCGQLHAERNAIKSLRESAEGGTIYVTLEPCCHYGRTPPCTEAIIENKIARVVIGSRDPNPLVSGKGAKILREHGIEVVEDFMREECDEINPVFFHYITKKTPYVLMKYAMTLDGKIACRTGASKWITGEKARAHVQKLRGEYSAVLAGIGTVLADDPMLNCRTEGAHQPLRVIVDSSLRIPMDSQLVKTANEFPVLVAYANADEEKIAALEKAGVQTICLPTKNVSADQNIQEAAEGFAAAVPDPNTASLKKQTEKASEADNSAATIDNVCTSSVDLTALMHYLGEQQIASVLVEGGGEIHESILRSGLADHVCAYIAPKLLGGRDANTPVEGLGVDVPDNGAQLCNMKFTRLDEDILLEYDVKKCFSK